MLRFLETDWNVTNREREEADSIFRSMVMYFRSHVGDDLSLVPATLHGTFENVDGGDVKMPNGMCALIDHFYVRLPKDMVLFHHQVTTTTATINTSAFHFFSFDSIKLFKVWPVDQHRRLTFVFCYNHFFSIEMQNFGLGDPFG